MTMSQPGQPTHTAAGKKHGHDKIDWAPEVWAHLNAAVRHEMARARVAAKFLPLVHVEAKTLTVPADSVALEVVPGGTPNPTTADLNGANNAPEALFVDEGAIVRINEYWVEFILTPAQVEHEATLTAHSGHGDHAAHEDHRGQAHGHHSHHAHHASTGITLATRAANILAQAEDSAIFLGATAAKGPLFTGAAPLVNYRNNGFPIDPGLLNVTQLLVGGVPPTISLQPVFPVGAPGGTYQEKTVGAVAQAYSTLQQAGQYGPYALVLATFPYADAHSPLPSTLILPAQPIKELVTAGFYGSGTLPPISGVAGGLLPPAADVDYTNPNPNAATGQAAGPFPVAYTGVLVSLGGNTMDLVRARLDGEHDVAVAFEQKDVDGNYRFRVYQRFALRLKDYTAVVRLDFV